MPDRRQVLVHDRTSLACPPHRRELGVIFQKRSVPADDGCREQRVAIAHALVFDRPFFFETNPSAPLDKKLREHLRNEIKTLHKEVGKTMIYVTSRL